MADFEVSIQSKLNYVIYMCIKSKDWGEIQQEAKSLSSVDLFTTTLNIVACEQTILGIDTLNMCVCGGGGGGGREFRVKHVSTIFSHS